MFDTIVNEYIHNYDSLVERFCWVDDFCRVFNQEYRSHLLTSEHLVRNRPASLSDSEVVTIMIEFHYSRYADFKAFYLEYALVHLKKLFPGLVSYNRFIELLP